MSPRNSSQYQIYIGAYAESENKTIYSYSFDPANHKLTAQAHLDGEDHSSFQIIDSARRILYSTCNLSNGDGGVASYRIDSETNELQLIHTQSAGGAGPSYLSLSNDGKYLLAANYRGGSVSVLPVDDGHLSEPIHVVKHNGSGPNKDRQEGPHPHSIQPGPGSNFVYACDLGTDQVIAYEIDSSGKLQLRHETKAQPGAGPRHMAFHPEAPYAYVINELNSTVTSYAYDAKVGTLSEIQTLSTLPEGEQVDNTAADIHFSPCGVYLYGSNRGHDSIVVYEVDNNTGQLQLVEHVSTEGKGPRNFKITPDGQFLITANQGTGNLVIFERESATGKLKLIQKTDGLLQPVCLSLFATN